jgi:hypothetical protein
VKLTRLSDHSLGKLNFKRLIQEILLRIFFIVFIVVLSTGISFKANSVGKNAGQTAKEVPSSNTPRLEQVWLSEGFSSPEGVAVFNNKLLISNVAGEATEKDGIGWISRVSKDGTVLEQKWVEGLNAPKGMAIHNGVLFVTDIDTIHRIDAESGERLNSIEIEGAVFLNDLTVWNDVVYASDSADASIHQVGENTSSLWMTDPQLAGVNGLFGKGDRLLVSTMREGALLSINSDQSIDHLAIGMNDADGIAAFDDDSYVISSWPGRIWYVSAEGAVISLLDSEADNINQNDLTRVDDLIVVPNWRPGTVTAWRLVL